MVIRLTEERGGGVKRGEEKTWKRNGGVEEADN